MEETGISLGVVTGWLVGAWCLLGFLRWLLTPPHWRDGEGPMIDEGERMSVEFSWLRWVMDRVSFRFWRW